MGKESRITAQGVGALIVPKDYMPRMFLGATHAQAKEASERLSAQASIFTETIEPGETHQDALKRMLKVEEVYVRGLSDQEPLKGVHLTTTLLRTRKGNALLTTYLFEASLDASVEIIDGEIAEVGWVPSDDVLNTPKGSWRVRFSVAESLFAADRYYQDPKTFKPSLHLNPSHRVPSVVYELMENGFSEKEALIRAGLIAPQVPNRFDHSQSVPAFQPSFA